MNKHLECTHFPKCGGCQFLGLSELEEQEKKTQFFLDAFKSHQMKVEIESYQTMPLRTRRRASLSAKRTKKSAILGFMEAKTHTIVDMNMCLVLEPSILALKPALLIITKSLASRSSTLKLHLTQLAHGFDLDVENAKAPTPQDIEMLARICGENSIHRLTLAGEVIFQDAQTEIDIDGFSVSIPPYPFLQATKQAENTLRALVHQTVSEASHIADLFSGIGTFSYGLTQNVDAYEGDASLSAAMQTNLHQLGLHNITTQTRDLFREPIDAKALADYDAVIIDPPRAGAMAQCFELAKSDVPIIAFVACDAGSFARDSKILMNGGYAMQPVRLIDQFRFSNHIESFTVFEKTR